MATTMSGAGLLIALGTWIEYLARIPRGKVPLRATGWAIAQWLAIALAVAAVVWSQQHGSLGITLAPSATTLVLAGVFLWLLAQRRTPIGELKVAVGDPLPPFSATTSDGAPFHSDTLGGKRTLLKFFRGGW